MAIVGEVVNRQRGVRFDPVWLGRIVRQAVAAVGREAADITLVVVNDRGIAAIHRRWLGIPGSNACPYLPSGP